MNENPQPEIGLTACPKCGGLRGDTFAGTPCSCIVSDSDRSYNPHYNADLKSEVERLKVELKEAQAKARSHETELVELHGKRQTLTKERDEAQAAEAVMREACQLAQQALRRSTPEALNLSNYRVATGALNSALATTAGTALLARMAEAEDLLRLRGGSDDPIGAIEWLERRDAFLKGEGVKA